MTRFAALVAGLTLVAALSVPAFADVGGSVNISGGGSVDISSGGGSVSVSGSAGGGSDSLSGSGDGNGSIFVTGH